jgi:5'-nucleotidase
VEASLDAATRESRRRIVMAAPGFWRNLPPLAVGFELLELVRELGFSVHVVTKGPHDAPAAWGDKVSWCRRHLPGVPVIVTDSKTLVFGHVLIDDWPPYVHDWQQQWPAALAVVPVQPWNEGLPVSPRLLRYDRAHRAEVRDALRELSARTDAQP